MKAVFSLLAGSVLLAAGSALASESGSVTRIETRPFYGATVTIEEGVRVFRPLPPHRHIVINPGGKANVSLNFEDNRSKNYNYNYDRGNGHNGGSASDAPVHGGYGGYGAYGGVAPRDGVKGGHVAPLFGRQPARHPHHHRPHGGKGPAH